MTVLERLKAAGYDPAKAITLALARWNVPES